MSESFTKVVHQGYGNRVGKSFGGIIAGLILFIAAFPFLFWNEGRAVKMHKSLEEGSNAVISVDANQINPDHEGDLIHITGKANTLDVLDDNQFGVSEIAIKLIRNVEMYQWTETQKSETKENLGGGSDTEIVYTYDEEWSDELIDSSNFEYPANHVNPESFPFEKQEYFAENVTVGAFALSPSLIKKIGGEKNLAMDESNIPFLNEEDQKKAKIQNGYLYIGDPAKPQIGDVRIKFSIIKPVTVSIVAVQRDNSFIPYQAKAGNAIELLSMGGISADEMFQEAISANHALTWILRVMGILMIFIGLAIMLKPLSVLGSLVPFLGRAIGMGTGILAFLLSIVFSFITIAVAWLYYRPLLSIILIAIAVAGTTYIVTYIKKNKAQPQPQNV
ncbi:MAG: TMEM43 family protein [Patescibacteria group bacterium]